MNKSIEELRHVLPNAVARQLMTEMCRAQWSNPSSRTIEELGVSVGTHPGTRRSRNEDRVLVGHIESLGGQCFTVALVCDGVGGSEMGDLAATIAIATCIGDLAGVRRTESVRDLLPGIIRNMDETVRGALKGKGATTVSALLASSKGDIALANVGDSRLFSWALGEQLFRQISVDDTLENELRNLPGRDLSALNARGLQGSLSQALGEVGRQSADLRVVVFGSGEFNRGAVLASDGAWKTASDAFTAIAQNAPSAAELVRRAVTSALWTGGVDNISVVALQDITRFISAAGNLAVKSERGRVTTWFMDTKLVLCDPVDRLRADQHAANHSAPEITDKQTEKKEKRRTSQRSKKQSPPRDKMGAQLELKVEQEDRSKEGSGEPKPKIVISTDDGPSKSE